MSSDIGLAEVGPGGWICGGAYLHANVSPPTLPGCKADCGIGQSERSGRAWI